jgi:hypothetical protein
MGRRRPGNPPHQKNKNTIEDLVGNEENKYLVPDPKRMMLIITNEPKDVDKKKNSQKGNYE